MPLQFYITRLLDACLCLTRLLQLGTCLGDARFSWLMSQGRLLIALSSPSSSDLLLHRTPHLLVTFHSDHPHSFHPCHHPTSPAGLHHEYVILLLHFLHLLLQNLANTMTTVTDSNKDNHLQERKTVVYSKHNSKQSKYTIKAAIEYHRGHAGSQGSH
jgi:hypothetical protein